MIGTEGCSTPMGDAGWLRPRRRPTGCGSCMCYDRTSWF